MLSENDLHAALNRADLAVNLRYPTRGEASGTLMRVWEHALPCLVTRTDAFASLPEDTVAFVDPENEAADIQHHLSAYLERPDHYRALGRRGRALLEQEHVAEVYARRLFQFLQDLRARGSNAFAAPFARRVASHVLAEISEPTFQDLGLERISTEIASWVGSPPGKAAETALR